MRARIEREIAGLPGPQREVLTLRDVERWTADDVSAALGISDARQRVLLHAARSRLRAAFDAIISEG
jgi:RNA polymerase sigma-70 factor (ECF subfamily)